jgi:hypothetical protein
MSRAILASLPQSSIDYQRRLGRDAVTCKSRSIESGMGRSIRSLIVVDPFFGAIAFVGVLIGDLTVEMADFEDDPDYWSVVDPPLD